MNIDISDAHKILDCLHRNEMFHRYRDLMNSQVHLAIETRFSPLTSETISSVERLQAIIGQAIKEGKT